MSQFATQIRFPAAMEDRISKARFLAMPGPHQSAWTLTCVPPSANMKMPDPNASQNISNGKSVPANSASDADRAIPPVDGLARLREVLNEASELPLHERNAWLARNIEDAEEREVIAALLLAGDGEEFIDVDAG